MTLQDKYKKWKENTLKKSLDRFKERREKFETSSGVELPRVALPMGGFDTPREEHAGLLNQRSISSNKFYKFVNAQSRLTNDGAKRASVEFFMVWNNNLTKWIITPQNHVTAFLSFQVKANFL